MPIEYVISIEDKAEFSAISFKNTCCECWDMFYNVIKFLPSLPVRKSWKPASVSNSMWQVLHQFFCKHHNRLFWIGITSKPCYRVDQQEEVPTIFHLEYTRDGVSIPNQCLVVVSRVKALDILRDIHCGSSEGGCQVVGVNSLVRQFSLEFFCNGIKHVTMV